MPEFAVGEIVQYRDWGWVSTPTGRDWGHIWRDVEILSVHPVKARVKHDDGRTGFVHLKNLRKEPPMLAAPAEVNYTDSKRQIVDERYQAAKEYHTKKDRGVSHIYSESQMQFLEALMKGDCFSRADLPEVSEWDLHVLFKDEMIGRCGYTSNYQYEKFCYMGTKTLGTENEGADVDVIE